MILGIEKYLHSVLYETSKHYKTKISAEQYTNVQNKVYKYIEDHGSTIDAQSMPEFKTYCRDLFEEYVKGD